MTTLQQEIEIDLPRDAVWKALADFGNICHGHPAVRKSWVTSTQKSGVGATRHCDFTMMGATAEERVTEWNDGTNIKIEVYQLMKMPGIKTMELNLSLRDHGAHTVLTGTMVYTMKNAFFDLMDTVMMRRMNADVLSGILAGHKKYIEIGEIVTNKTVLNKAQVVVVI